MSRKWLTTHAPTVAALTLALTLGGVGAATAADSVACPAPDEAVTSQSVVTDQPSDSAGGTATDTGGSQTMSPATWYPPA